MQFKKKSFKKNEGKKNKKKRNINSQKQENVYFEHGKHVEETQFLQHYL